MTEEDQSVGVGNKETRGLSSDKFEKIKNDILSDAKTDATEGTDTTAFTGFYDHNHNRYARVISGDFSEGYDQSKVEYDKDLTPEETDEIRKALYDQFGAVPPADEEFDKQKQKSDDWRASRDAVVDTNTNLEGVMIRELRRWRVLSEDLAAEHGINPLDFTQWGIMIVKSPVQYAGEDEPGPDASKAVRIPISVTPEIEQAGLDKAHEDEVPEMARKNYDLELISKGALEEIDRLMDKNRRNLSPLAMKALDEGRRFLENLSSIEEQPRASRNQQTGGNRPHQSTQDAPMLEGSFDPS